MRVPGDSSLVSMTNLDPYQNAKAKQRKIMHHRYPWKTPKIVPFFTPQIWASSRFLSYLNTFHITLWWTNMALRFVIICKAEQLYTSQLLWPPHQMLLLSSWTTGPRPPRRLPSHRTPALVPSTWPRPSATTNTQKTGLAIFNWQRVDLQDNFLQWQLWWWELTAGVFLYLASERF